MNVPDSIRQLAQERLDARAARDFAKADALRQEILQSGYEVLDVADGFEFRIKAPYITYPFPRDIRPIDTSDGVSVAMIIDGFTDDAVETVKSIKAHAQCGIVLLCIGDAGKLVDEMDDHTYLIALNAGASWGEAANALLNKINSKYLILMDPSTRFTGDAIAPVIAELEKGEYAAVGWRGGLINIDDEWRSVDDKGDGEVDVLFSYFMGLNRAYVLEAGGFNARAVYYRNADIEFSLKLRHAGGRLLQMALPLEQGRHHGYHDADPEYREVQSKKNYDRILERFRGKSAILSPRR
ncbi:MAG: hypothetical protein F2888_03805 [Actinobacteria bacterium]|uniref:Unannotated protein n=4 Tax=freshwater metagenome TaxID=449393 RepID=A0A6J6MPC2_9ZZZZ|nr:hypothetical protein [Actinomycetota bacterium]MSZ63231.1 hypothetical protein [Actinomycetota bacterium]